MSVVFSRPYQFVPPHHGNIWPRVIQRFRLVDRALKWKEGVVNYECRGLEHCHRTLDRGDGMLWAPNHCRYSDPLVMVWPARELKTHVFAMASWHLFNQSWFDSFAIRMMGGFSVNREGADRQSVESAIDILADAVRPLILFPEGTTSRTNDHLMPLLEGVSFIARTAARRRMKKDGGRVVIHPIGLKYLCETDVEPWAKRHLERLEKLVGWHPRTNRSVLNRTVRMAEALLSLKEIEYFGRSQSGELADRRDALIEHALSTTEQRLKIEPEQNAPIRERVRAIRSDAASRFFDTATSTAEQERLQRDVVAADLAQELTMYHENYLMPETATDTRIVETIQRMQESFTKNVDASMPLKVVIEFDEAIEVPAEKGPRDVEDPILVQLREQLETMVQRLAGEARPPKNAS